MPKTIEDVRFRVPNDTRKFEIGLFWQRAIFFGGFISIIFVGFYSIDNANFRFLLSVFGMLCSFFWTLANKGSKFWQENWEGQIDHSHVLGKINLFGNLYRRKNRGILGAERFSPSKLAIALSMYITFLWVLFTIKSFLDLQTDFLRLLGGYFLIFTLFFGLFVYYKSSYPKDRWDPIEGEDDWEIRKRPDNGVNKFE